MLVLSLAVVLCLSRDWCAFFIFANVVIMAVYAPGHRGRIWNPFSKKISLLELDSF